MYLVVPLGDIYAVCCCDCYTFCWKMAYELLEIDFVIFTSDLLTTIISENYLQVVLFTNYSYFKKNVWIKIRHPSKHSQHT